MTEDTTADEQPKTLKVFTCINRRHPTRSCYALIEDTDDMRAKHRAWHVSEEQGREAHRDAIKARDDEIARLHSAIAEYRRDVAGFNAEVANFHGEVRRVETPIVPPQLEINRDGYTDDETEDEPDVDDEDFRLPTPVTDDARSTYLSDEQTSTGEPLTYEQTVARESAAVAFATTDDDTFPPTPRFVG